MQNLNSQLATIIDDLSENGYAICDAFLSAEIITALADKAKKCYLNGAMAAAKTGQSTKTLNSNIRGDSIFWLNETSENTSVQAYFNKMHLLRNALNQDLFMNVQELETHLAVYPIGSAYKKHLDQFQHGETIQARQLSSVLYLNQDWHTEDGGALRLHVSDSNYIDILPTAGKLVLFLSNKFWHEVCFAKVDRISLTGWFRTRALQ
jgi:SM-20-related protein